MTYIQDHIPKSKKKRPGILIVPQFITIHNTGNPKSTASNERQWLTNPRNINSVSWHIVIDALSAIEAVPLNEMAYHAGTAANKSSIGVEICESGNFEANKKAAILVIAKLLYERHWGIEKLKKHQDWTGKNCPRLLIPKWIEFTSAIDLELQKMKGKEA